MPTEDSDEPIDPTARIAAELDLARLFAAAGRSYAKFLNDNEEAAAMLGDWWVMHPDTTDDEDEPTKDELADMPDSAPVDSEGGEM